MKIFTSFVCHLEIPCNLKEVKYPFSMDVICEWPLAPPPYPRPSRTPTREATCTPSNNRPTRWRLRCSHRSDSWWKLSSLMLYCTVLYKSNFCPMNSDNCNQSGIQNPSIWGAYRKIPRHSFWDMATLTCFFWQPWKMKFRFQGFWP